MGEDPVLDQPSEDDEPPALTQSSSDDEEASSEGDGLDYEPPPLLSYILSNDNGTHFSIFPAYHAYNRADESGAMNRDLMHARVMAASGAMNRDLMHARVMAASGEGCQEPTELSPEGQEGQEPTEVSQEPTEVVQQEGQEPTERACEEVD
jgi:hypothetical protein